MLSAKILGGGYLLDKSILYFVRKDLPQVRLSRGGSIFYIEAANARTIDWRAA